jgi:membrane-bound metal-dependent hydrolase YbcI (DUF457 family)
MPGYQQHRTIGGLVGGTTALVCAQNQPPLLALAETIGGFVAGQYAGTWADALEPATSSYHRDFCHALVPTAYATTCVFQQVESLQTYLRSQAQGCFQLAASTEDGLQQFLNIAAGLLLHGAAGAVPAIAASYISHIALDAVSPRGVPLISRRF